MTSYTTSYNEPISSYRYSGLSGDATYNIVDRPVLIPTFSSINEPNILQTENNLLPFKNIKDTGPLINFKPIQNPLKFNGLSSNNAPLFINNPKYKAVKTHSIPTIPTTLTKNPILSTIKLSPTTEPPLSSKLSISNSNSKTLTTSRLNRLKEPSSSVISSEDLYKSSSASTASTASKTSKTSKRTISLMVNPDSNDLIVVKDKDYDFLPHEKEDTIYSIIENKKRSNIKTSEKIILGEAMIKSANNYKGNDMLTNDTETLVNKLGQILDFTNLQSRNQELPTLLSGLAERWAIYLSLGPIARNLLDLIYGRKNEDKDAFLKTDEISPLEQYIIEFDKWMDDEMLVSAIGSRIGLYIGFSYEYFAHEIFVDKLVEYINVVLKGPLIKGIPNTQQIIDMSRQTFKSYLQRYQISFNKNVVSNNIITPGNTNDDEFETLYIDRMTVMTDIYKSR